MANENKTRQTEKNVLEFLSEWVEDEQKRQDSLVLMDIMERVTETRPYQEVDMKKALLPYKKGVQSMTIITCEGTYSNTKKTYDNRTVVYAERVK